jgi:4-hydroxybenzoate polyprenyltransferase
MTAPQGPGGGGQRAFVSLARPFTLVAPALGFLSGAATAYGASPREGWHASLLAAPLIGSAMAALLNAGNNALNQIYDLDIDRVNKPKRPLPSGRLTIGQAWRFTAITYALALVLAWLVTPQGSPLSLPALSAANGSKGRHECFWLVAVAGVCTLLYSVPPFRTKRLGIWANVTIAIPRGVLLKVAGWSSVKTVIGLEPWYIGAIFGLFLLGATTTKDFADMDGDRRGGCRTLPIQYGVRRAAWMISPSFVVPFLMIPLGAWMHVLTGNFWLLQALGAVMTAYGVYVCYLMLRRPEELAVEENHVSWAHMYRMMFVAQIGFAIAYLL